MLVHRFASRVWQTLRREWDVEQPHATGPALPVGTKVIDYNGAYGTISIAIEFDGWRWYIVRFEEGETIRYDCEVAVVGERV